MKKIFLVLLLLSGCLDAGEDVYYKSLRSNCIIQVENEKTEKIFINLRNINWYLIDRKGVITIHTGNYSFNVKDFIKGSYDEFFNAMVNCTKK
ncbi:MAG: hypothetical protein WA916_08725 [Arcobacter sp.]|uniref:hypothetical protein n=1 Tax=Arcobacter sp. TaxID=1872629 RepID=UPI003C79242D